MFEMHATPRWSELASAREDLGRRLDVYQQQYRAHEAQYAELGIVRKRNLEKVLRTLERQERISSSRSEAMDTDYQHFQQSSRSRIQGSLDGTSHAQRSLRTLQQSYYTKMQRMMPSWEEHKTKLKLQKLSDLQQQKVHLEEQRIRVAELSKYNAELDARLYQFAGQVQTLEQQVLATSSEQAEKQRHQKVREQQAKNHHYLLEQQVQRALQEDGVVPQPRYVFLNTIC